MRAEIADKAEFDTIRYAQLWEDADVLLKGLDTHPGATLVSICSAGDNALAMLTLDPKRIIVIDLSPAQIACLNARIAAIKTLNHQEFLELMGAQSSARRSALLTKTLSALQDQSERAFWEKERTNIIKNGLGGVGKFERYFAIFRNWLLPIVHGKQTIDDVFIPRNKTTRQHFFNKHWNTWRWRLLLKSFFSRTVMGQLGRDPAFFDHVEGSVADHVDHRIRHAAIDLDPSQNPYLHWILKGNHSTALPLPWRPEHYSTIASRLDRLEIRNGALETLVAKEIKADGFNLSDIFEYMEPSTFSQVYGELLKAANPGARFVYWNMMAPRRVPDIYKDKIRTLTEVEEQGKANDKAFFYSDFVVEEVRSS